LFQKLIKALTFDAIVAFLGDVAIGFNEVNRFKVAVTNEPIDNAFGDFQFVGNLLDGEPVVSRCFSGAFNHLKEPAKIGEQVSTDRTISTVKLTLSQIVYWFIHRFDL
jgi:hypothetical protein